MSQKPKESPTIGLVVCLMSFLGGFPIYYSGEVFSWWGRFLSFVGSMLVSCVVVVLFALVLESLWARCEKDPEK